MSSPKSGPDALLRFNVFDKALSGFKSFDKVPSGCKSFDKALSGFNVFDRVPSSFKCCRDWSLLVAIKHKGIAMQCLWKMVS